MGSSRSIGWCRAVPRSAAPKARLAPGCSSARSAPPTSPDLHHYAAQWSTSARVAPGRRVASGPSAHPREKAGHTVPCRSGHCTKQSLWPTFSAGIRSPGEEVRMKYTSNRALMCQEFSAGAKNPTLEPQPMARVHHPGHPPGPPPTRRHTIRYQPARNGLHCTTRYRLEPRIVSRQVWTGVLHHGP